MHRGTRKRSTKRLKKTGNLFRKNLQLKVLSLFYHSNNMHIDTIDKTIDNFPATFITLENFPYLFATSLFLEFLSFLLRLYLVFSILGNKMLHNPLLASAVWILEPILNMITIQFLETT